MLSQYTDDPNQAFKDVNWALLVGSFPRKQGMERKDLLGINGKIFVGQGKALAAKGWKVVFASREPKSEKTQEVIKQVPGSSADHHKEALAGVDIAFLATNWAGTEQCLKESCGAALNGKILVDATNPLHFPSFEVMLPPNTSGGEEVQKWAPGAKVIKAFNTSSCEHYTNPTFAGGAKADLYVAGSDEQAKVKVLKLGQELGFEPIDVGPLSRARGTEHLAALWVQLAYLQKLGTGFAFKIIKK